MNTVQILGNLARDPEVRYTQSGRAVATFTVAATNTYIDSTTNETKEQTVQHGENQVKALVICVKAIGRLQRVDFKHGHTKHKTDKNDM